MNIGHRSSMRDKILLVCISSVLITLISLIMLFQNTSTRTIYQQSKDSMYHSMENLQNDLDEIFTKMESGLIGVYSQRELMEDLKKSKDIEALRSDNYFVAQDMAINNFQENENVVAIYIYNDLKELVSCYRHAVTPAFRYPEDIFSDETYNGYPLKQYIDAEQKEMFISSYYNDSRSKQIVRFALNIFQGSKRIGCVVCDVDSRSFQEVMKRYAVEDNNIIWMQPIGDEVSVSFGTINSKYVDYYKQTVSNVRNASSADEVIFQVKEGVLFRFPENKYNLELYSYMPSSILMENQKRIMRNLILVVIAVLIIAALLSTGMAYYMVQPLKKLTDTMRRIREGNTKLRVEKLGTDEIEELGDTFNKMLDEMEGLIAKEYQSKLMLNQLEYKALQAQINPHFLYNTLDTMSSIAEIQNCPMVSNLSQALSHIFRYTLDMKHPFSTVEKEIMHLKNYIYVMNVRMDHQIAYQLDIDSHTLSQYIPRLTIQPIVENAIKHGIRNVRGKKEIHIQTSMEKENLVIRITDNGEGFDAKMLNEELRKNELDYVEKGDSIGLHNINARIKMLCGQEYGIVVESNQGKGTTVMVTLLGVGEETVNEWKTV